MNYTLAWLVVGAAGLLGTLAVFVLTRSVAHAGLRWMLRLLPVCLMAAPAPVPDYPGHIAPAFIVFAFESLFQTDGAPLLAGLVLIAAALIGVCAGLLLGRAGGRETAQKTSPN